MNQSVSLKGDEQLEQVAQESLAGAVEGDSPESAGPQKGPHRPDRRARKERRVHPRYQLTTTAEVLDLSSGALCSARTSDISRGGCFIDTTSPFAVGTLVKVRLTQDKGAFITQAVITSSMAGMGMGVKFTDVEAQQVEVLEKWILQLSGSLPHDFTGFEEGEETSDEVRLKAEFHYTLNELIVALMRKGIVSEGQGKEMLRRLHF